jgi:hypothetical protein
MSGALAAGARVRNWYFGPAALRFDDNQLAVAESRGGNSITRHDSMSVLRMVTDATGILIDGLASQAAASNQECLGVYCNGAWLTSVSFATQNTMLTKAVALPVGAGKIVEIWEGAQLDVSGGLDGSDVRGAYAYAVRGLTGFAPAATPPRKIVVYGDSIACGYYATIPVRDGWFPQARLAYQLAGGRMALEAWGGRSIGREPDVDAEAARLVAHVAGSATRIILITIGTNDFGLGTARATFRRPRTVGGPLSARILGVWRARRKTTSRPWATAEVQPRRGSEDGGQDPRRHHAGPDRDGERLQDGQQRDPDARAGVEEQERGRLPGHPPSRRGARAAGAGARGAGPQGGAGGRQGEAAQAHPHGGLPAPPAPPPPAPPAKQLPANLDVAERQVYNRVAPPSSPPAPMDAGPP